MNGAWWTSDAAMREAASGVPATMRGRELRALVIRAWGARLGARLGETRPCARRLNLGGLGPRAHEKQLASAAVRWRAVRAEGIPSPRARRGGGLRR